MLLLLALVACESAPPDPRPALVSSWTGLRRVKLDPARALEEARYGEACAGLKQSLASGSAPPEHWPRLLQVAARDPSCLDRAAADALATWGAGKPEWKDAEGEWRAAQGLPVDLAALSPDARLSVLMRGSEVEPVVAAAKAVLAADPTDARACAIVIEDEIDRGELDAALSRCSRVATPALVHLRAGALDEAGRWEAAVTAYDAAGFTLHAAAILYQEGLADEAGINPRLEEPVPPAALHRAWWDLLRGRQPRVAQLDESLEAQLVRALAGDSVALAALPGLPGMEARVLHARLTGDVVALDALLAADPDQDLLWRARIGVTLERGLELADALARLAARDADHLRLSGVEERREAPWRVLVPYRWADLTVKVPEIIAAGEDDVGRAWRAAQTLSEAERSAALAALQAEHPALRGLARARAGGSILDGPPAGR